MLADEQVRQFREDGYLVFEALIQGERLAYYKQVFDELVAEGRKLTEQVPHWTLELDECGEPRAGLLHKIQGVCVVDSRVLELARETAILDRVAVLIGENFDVFGTKFFPKLPNGGTSTGWHQDSFYFGTDTDRIISCGIYLEDSDVENGCLRVVPGSHRMGEIVEHRRNPSRHGSWTEVDDRGLWIWSFPLARLFCFPPISCTVLMITTAIARAIVRHGIICPKNSIQKSF